ncbi:MAG: tetratricopeptide repeat protein [Chloroflexi bacterium]|nr:tetratricopeptide repeat protein [Chloroflexota bacterium]
MANRTSDELKEEGLALFRRGDYDGALGAFETAVSIYVAQNDELGQAEALNNMGVIYRVKREWETAVATLQQAAAIFKKMGDANRQAQTLANLGDLQAVQKKRDEAARSYSQAAALFAQHNDPAKQSQVLRALSLLRLRQGQWMNAMMRMEESLTVAPRLGPGKWLLRVLLRLALGLFRG